MNIKSDIGECVSVLHHKAWGKTLVGNRIRSKTWWETRLNELIKSPSVDIVIDPNFDPCANIDVPIPFEKEMGLDTELSEHWLGWFQQVFKKRYEQQTKS